LQKQIEFSTNFTIKPLLHENDTGFLEEISNFSNMFFYPSSQWLAHMLDDGMIIYITLALGLIFSLLIVIFCNKIALHLGVVDHPGAQEHKGHAAPTPLVGGLVAIPPAIAILLLQFFQEGMSSAHAAPYLALAFATLSSLIVGFFDDRRHIPALFRLFICSGIFGVAISIRPEFVVSALDLQGLGLKVELGLLAIPFSVFCLLVFQNAVNMTDGRNGLVAGVTIIWLLSLLSYGWDPLTLAIISLIIGLVIALGANLSGRLFLGDSGTYGIGAFVGLATIWIHQSNIGLYTIDVVIMFIIPVLDMARLFVLRIFHGRHPFSADHNHLHHYLDRSMGWAHGRQVYYALVAAPILAARLQLMESSKVLIFAIILYVLVIFLAQSAGRIKST
jgi:UDP-GlcNAc:undecaprenyl-phosphate GlcNAc-1-phosphate transferase